MTIVLEQGALPEKGLVELSIQRSFEIKVTAKEAQRQVNRWVLLEVSCVMGAEPPTLVIGERARWRVPIVLTAPHVGIVGEAGVVNVDVETGEMDNTPKRLTEIQQSGMALGQKMPPYTQRKDVPVKYLAKDIQPTHPKPSRRRKLPPEIVESVSAD